ncbi:carboxypeptidase O-like [Hyperolius riggenbachi]|uniref:carboxypeptidase O-like n=1 Tax=Hyperolius riggenbachi TaxID=752182 RepID=UPI0035A37CFF
MEGDQRMLWDLTTMGRWKKPQLDLWKPDIAEEIYIGNEVHVRVPATHTQQMKENLFQQNIPFKIMIEDLQILIDRSSASHSKARAVSLETYDYTVYHPIDEIYEWMEQIKDAHGNLVTHHILGHTYEERPIFYFKIGFPSAKTKKAIFMDCGIHAREWIAIAYCQWFVKEILNQYREDPLLTKMLKQVDFYVVPVLNADGYVYSWTDDRLWRKNRSPQDNGTCFGVDLNRNFDSQWGTIGTSHDCEVITYCGPSSASELETKAVVRLVEQLQPNVLMYLTIHSYGQLILLPYGYKYFPSVNHYEMTKLAERAAEKLKEEHDSIYVVGSTAVILYYTSGSSADWAADEDIRFSYTYELRDDGEYGFELPAEEIKPTCEEVFTSMLLIFDHIDEHYLGPLEGSAVAVTSASLTFLSFAVCIYFALMQ